MISGENGNENKRHEFLFKFSSFGYYCRWLNNNVGISSNLHTPVWQHRLINRNDLRNFKVIRFDPLAPVQNLVQRYTLQMKMFFSVNYIITLNCGCPEIVFSLPDA